MKHRTTCLVANLFFASALLLPFNFYGQTVSLDSSFGTNGKVLTDFGGSSEYGRSVALQDDGKIVVAGNRYGPYNDFGVARYNVDGSPDVSFNSSGKVITSIGSFADKCASVAIQSDGKIVVAGDSYNGTDYVFAAIRYNADGSLDSTFDNDGIVTTDIGNFDDRATSVAIQSDGKILLAGTSSDGAYGNFAIVRYNKNGSLDNTFDTDGKVTTDIGTVSDNANAVTIQSDGKIVVAGDSYNGTDFDFAVARYRTNGSLDTSFDTDGIATTSISALTTGLGSGFDHGTAVAMQSDGKIVVSGYTPSHHYAVVRYNINGGLDTSFDGDGKVTTLVAGSQDGTSMVLQSNGKILLAGAGMSLVRYNINGGVDSTFDLDGIVTIGFPPYMGKANSMVLQSDGKIVVAGFAINGTDADFAVVRFNNTSVTGIAPLTEPDIKFTIYPNPSSGHLTVNWTGSTDGWLQVNNLLGKEVLRKQVANNMKLFLPQKGVYFLKIQEGQTVFNRKIVID